MTNAFCESSQEDWCFFGAFLILAIWSIFWILASCILVLLWILASWFLVLWLPGILVLGSLASNKFSLPYHMPPSAMNYHP